MSTRRTRVQRHRDAWACRTTMRASRCRQQLGVTGRLHPEGREERRGGQGIPEVLDPAEGHRTSTWRPGLGRWLPAMPALVKRTRSGSTRRTRICAAYVQQGLLGPTVPDYSVLQPWLCRGPTPSRSGASADGRRRQGRDDAGGGGRQGVQADRGDLREIPDGARAERQSWTSAPVLDCRPPRRPAAAALSRSLARRPQGLGVHLGVAFVVPYIAVFLAFVAYPVVYGLWLGQRARASTPSCSPTRSTSARWSTRCSTSASA